MMIEVRHFSLTPHFDRSVPPLSHGVPPPLPADQHPSPFPLNKTNQDFIHKWLYIYHWESSHKQYSIKYVSQYQHITQGLFLSESEITLNNFVHSYNAAVQTERLVGVIFISLRKIYEGCKGGANQRPRLHCQASYSTTGPLYHSQNVSSYCICCNVDIIPVSHTVVHFGSNASDI